jgi:two-component system sensor kinase FixL
VKRFIRMGDDVKRIAKKRAVAAGNSAAGVGGGFPDTVAADPFAQARLLGIVAAAPDAILTVDEDQRITLFNAAAEQMFRCPASEAIGSSLNRFIPQRFRQSHREHVARFGATGVTSRIMGHQRPLAALRADGVEFPVEATISQVTVDGRKLFTAIVRDITARRHGEQALAESEARFRAIFESAVDGIVTVDEAGIVASFNPAASRIFGYTAQEVVGRNVSMLMPEPDRGRHDDYMGTYLRTETKKIIGIGREVVGVRKDGTKFPMDLAVSETPIGERRVFTGIVRDITDRKRAEESLAKQREDLARSNVELERFAYVASHDLQEPMRTVRSFAQLLQRRHAAQFEGDAAEYMQFITEGVQRMQTLINDLLAYSRVSSQGAAFAPAHCDQILLMVLQSLHSTIEQQKAKITADPLPTVLGDSTQLGQVLQNLLSNAIKFRRRERRPEIHVSAESRKNEWVFAVRDNGIGIEPQYFERIFIIFQRLHTIEEYGGTGIGLAICKKIIERHGGRIWVESTAGEGTMFYFSVPKREEPQHES